MLLRTFFKLKNINVNMNSNSKSFIHRKSVVQKKVQVSSFEILF